MSFFKLIIFTPSAFLKPQEVNSNKFYTFISSKMQYSVFLQYKAIPLSSYNLQFTIYGTLDSHSFKYMNINANSPKKVNCNNHD